MKRIVSSSIVVAILLVFSCLPCPATPMDMGSGGGDTVTVNTEITGVQPGGFVFTGRVCGQKQVVPMQPTRLISGMGGSPPQYADAGTQNTNPDIGSDAVYDTGSPASAADRAKFVYV